MVNVCLLYQTIHWLNAKEKQKIGVVALSGVKGRNNG